MLCAKILYPILRKADTAFGGFVPSDRRATIAKSTRDNLLINRYIFHDRSSD